MRGAQPVAVIAMKVLVEEEVIAPMRIILKQRGVSECWAASGLGIAQKYANESLSERASHCAECHRLVRLIVDESLKLGAERLCQLAKRLNQKKARGKPNRPAPIGVASFDFQHRLGRLIND